MTLDFLQNNDIHHTVTESVSEREVLTPPNGIPAERSETHTDNAVIKIQFRDIHISSLSNTELAENIIQQILRGDFSGLPAKRRVISPR